MTATPEWTVGRSTRCCAATGRALVEGEECYSALREDGDRFVREDYSGEAWPDAPREGFFSYWKTRIPDAAEADRKRLVFDVEAFHRFYADLADSDDAPKILFRGVVALMLVRKRVLRLDGVEKRGDGDLMMIYDRRRERHDAVPVPDATPEQIAAVEQELLTLLET